MTDKKDDEMNVKSSNQVLKITDQAVAAAISLRQANTDWHGLDLRVAKKKTWPLIVDPSQP
jgi:hypothetical protein